MGGVPNVARNALVRWLWLETGAALRTFTRTTTGETFGYDSVGIGDVNDDGEGDFLISATFGERAYVIAGARTCLADFDRDGRIGRRDPSPTCSRCWCATRFGSKPLVVEADKLLGETRGK